MVFGAMYRDEVSSYYTPLICLNGHVLTTSLQSHPETQSEYCSQCGEKTISKCPSCQEDIRGKHNVPGVVGWGYELPLHCHKCGKQYPWTENRIKAAKDYTDLIDELNAVDKEAFKKDIVAITKNTPEAQVAALRFKKTLAKVGKPVAGAMKEILVDITSESIKKIIWPDK